MRERADAEMIRRFMRRLGTEARGEGRVYFTGGVTAVLLGWRESTADVDLAFDPEPPGAFEALARLKDELGVNVELASPAHFVPPLPGWRERSRPIGREGRVDFLHYDPYSQALSKIERDHEKDRADVHRMVAGGLVDPRELERLFESVAGELVRYPALDADAFRAKVRRFVEEEGRA